MLDAVKSFFDDSGFMPHGMCLLWRPDILWTHVAADALTVVSYLSIPAALITFAHRRRDFPHIWILYLFGAFIVCCGLTHAVSIWTFWVPAYGIQAVVKVVTAAVSMTTAVMLWPLMPRALRIPSPAQLQRKNEQLQKEVADRLAVEHRLYEFTATLEARVEERTRALTIANAHLETEVDRRRRGEEQILKAKSEAEAANRAKTVFLAGMSHELRSPLNAILGFAQMLDQVHNEGMDPRQREYLKDIQTSGNMLLDLIERLLDLSMVESGRSNIRIEPTDVGSCLDKARSILEPFARSSGVTVSIRPPEGEPAVVAADPTRLLQIIVNLGTNGIKYNRPGGRIDISVLTPPGDDVVLRFADTGVGIPTRYHRLVFQPFNRLNHDQSSIDGTGIGLALSKRLAQAMGADLSFESIEGRGTTFDLALQRARPFLDISAEDGGANVELP